MFYDLESTHLKADWGWLLSSAVKYSNKKTAECKSIGPNARCNDQTLVEWTLEKLAKADLMVGWYSKGFDYKLLLTKCVEYRIIPPPLPQHLDLWVTPYSDWLLQSNRLENVQQFLNLPDSKTKIWKKHWKQAMSGDRKSLAYIVEHNIQDVIVLEQAYNEIRPYIKGHPTMTLIQKGSCPVCVKGTLESKGWRYTKTGKYRQYLCRQCKHYSRDTKRTEGVSIVPV